MQSFDNYDETEDFHFHQYRLLHYVSYELIAVAVIVSSGYAFKQLWYLMAVIGIGGIFVFLNLLFFKRIKNIHISSNVLMLIIFITITSANYLVWGINTEYSYWFYIMPLLAAASLVGWTAMIIYSTLAFLMISTFGILSIPPYYNLPPRLLHIIEWANHLFAYVITVTIVVHLTLESKYFEKVLSYKNRLLADEKLKYQRLAYVDQLTNLPNRQFFKQSLKEKLASLKSNQCVTVFFMDLDNLKYVNDCYGHEGGDKLLIQAARRIQKSVGEANFVARLGGDEFTAIVIHTQEDDIPAQIANGITQAFEKPFVIDAVKCNCSISIGFSNCPRDSHTVRQLMVKADKAMYAEKRSKGELKKNNTI